MLSRKREDTNKEWKDIKNIKKDLAVFAFGRFQPPTIGHQIIINKVRKICQEYSNKNPSGFQLKNTIDAIIFVSSTQNNMEKYKKSKTYKKMKEKQIFCWNSLNKNPLTPESRIHFLNKMYNYGQLFPIQFLDAKTSHNPNPFKAIANLSRQYKKVIFLCGTDRYPSYKKIADKFNNVMIEEIVRDETDVEELIELWNNKLAVSQITGKTLVIDPSQMSGTAMRSAALENNYDILSTGIGGPVLKKKMPNNIWIEAPSNIKGTLLTKDDIFEMGNLIKNGTYLNDFPNQDETNGWKKIGDPEFCKKWKHKWKTPKSWKPHWRRRTSHITRKNRKKQMEKYQEYKLQQNLKKLHISDDDVKFETNNLF